MIVMINSVAYFVRDLVDTSPIQVMLIAIPAIILVLATIAITAAKLLEAFLHKPDQIH